MHRSVFEAILRTRERLVRFLEEKERPDYDPQWRPLEPSEVPDTVVAVDGSLNHSPRTSHLIVALTGLSLLFSKDREPGEEAISHVDVIDRGIFRRMALDSVLGTWMRLAEIKSVLRLSPPEESIVLMDGSFVSDVINPKPTPEWISAHLSEEDREVMEGLDDELASMGLYDRIREEFHRHSFTSLYLLDTSDTPGRKEHRYMALALLLYREHLEALSRLIAGGWTVVFVSKRSTSNDYIKTWDYRGIYSDQVLFSLFTRGRGFAPPLRVRFPEKEGDEDPPPKKYGLGKDYAHILDVEVYETFVRFSEYSPLTYKVEVVGTSEDGVEGILSEVASLSPGGYPIPLEKAHKEVVITYSDMELISQVITPIEMSVREALK